MLFCITLGDWLGKGHDIKEDFLYDCNRPAAEIAAAYHYSVALFADFLYVIYAGAVLYFGDYVYAVAAVLAEKCLEINEILSA